MKAAEIGGFMVKGKGTTITTLKQLSAELPPSKLRQVIKSAIVRGIVSVI